MSNKLDKLLKYSSVILGLISFAFFVYDFFLFSKLHPQMVNFEVISPTDENLLNLVGIGLLTFLAFYSLSLFRLISYLKKAKKITFPLIIFSAIGVLSLLFVFSDWALLSDIVKQYKYGLAQPEWSLVYPIMISQLFTVIIFTYLHLFWFKKENLLENVACDSNIFLIVQYIGIICGLMGLAFASLGFFFPRAWNLEIHSTLTPIILLIPYALAVLYWLITKLQEGQHQWYDEKQVQDIGKSAFVTLISTIIFMTALFIANYNNLGGVVSILWLPLYLFLVLVLFSAGNLFFSNKNY